MKITRHTLSVFFFALACIIATSCSNPGADKSGDKAATDKTAAEADPYDAQLQLIAKTSNAAMPMKLGEGISIDKVEALPGRKLLYKCSIAGIAPGTLDTTQFKATVTPQLTQTLSNTPAIKTFAENKVTIIYQYNGQDNAYLFSIYLTPDMYK